MNSFLDSFYDSFSIILINYFNFFSPPPPAPPYIPGRLVIQARVRRSGAKARGFHALARR